MFVLNQKTLFPTKKITKEIKNQTEYFWKEEQISENNA
jgi:hypothetical protein